MNLFKNISDGFLFLLLGMFFVLCRYCTFTGFSGVVLGIWFVLIIFKQAMKVAEFEMRYSKAIGVVDEAKDSFVDDKPVKKDGVWL